MEWPGQMDGDERKGGKGDTVLSAKEWAQLRLVWLASKRDVLRGYRERIDLTAIFLRVAVILLAGYSIYLLYCESCKDEHYELYRHLLMAVSDAISGARGSISGTIVVLLCMVWLSTVLWMRQRPEVLLVDFQTYRHAAIDGGDAVNQAGEPVMYERFLAVSKAAVGVFTLAHSSPRVSQLAKSSPPSDARRARHPHLVRPLRAPPPLSSRAVHAVPRRWHAVLHGAGDGVPGEDPAYLVHR